MAASHSSDGAGQLSKEPETTTSTFKIYTKLPRRQLTLIAITVLLNVLLWTSLICLVTTVHQIAVRPDDTTNIPSEVLTLTSVSALPPVFLHRVLTYLVPCYSSIHCSTYYILPEAKDMEASEAASINRQEDILYRRPRRCLVVHSLALDLRLEHDHCRSPASMSTCRTWPFELGGRPNVLYWPGGYRLCNDCAVGHYASHTHHGTKTT
jgi:hypothetical protein